MHGQFHDYCWCWTLLRACDTNMVFRYVIMLLPMKKIMIISSAIVRVLLLDPTGVHSGPWALGEGHPFIKIRDMPP